MEVNDPPNRTRYVKESALRLAGQNEFPSACPTIGLQKLNFSIADNPGLTVS